MSLWSTIPSVLITCRELLAGLAAVSVTSSTTDRGFAQSDVSELRIDAARSAAGCGYCISISRITPLFFWRFLLAAGTVRLR
jgi:hypothetical protein